jgi:glucose/arabinose dehydrogenase
MDQTPQVETCATGLGNPQGFKFIPFSGNISGDDAKSG